MKKNLLIIGAGFVGGTCYKVFHQLENWNVSVHDLKPEDSFLFKTFPEDFPGSEISWASFGESPDQLIKDADLIMVALPTPMVEETGECHTGILESAIKNVRRVNQRTWICIKSTIPPGTTQKFHEKWRNICFNPEFLTEANALNDFVNLHYQIIGSPYLMDGVCDSVDNPIFDLYGDCTAQGILPIQPGALIEVHSSMAEMIKYTRNCYLATRLSFFNEMKQICDKLEIDFEAMKYWAGLDRRIGQHYNKVREGSPGFGGHCLPKDINALIYLAKENGVSPLVLEGVWNKNAEVREDKDWEKMKDRAVINLDRK